MEKVKEQTQFAKDRAEELVSAKPGTDYHGRIVSIHGNVVVQRDARTNALIAHSRNSLTGGHLTVDQDLKITYPRDSAIGLVSPVEKEFEAQPSHDFQKDREKELER